MKEENAGIGEVHTCERLKCQHCDTLEYSTNWNTFTVERCLNSTREEVLLCESCKLSRTCGECGEIHYELLHVTDAPDTSYRYVYRIPLKVVNNLRTNCRWSFDSVKVCDNCFDTIQADLPEENDNFVQCSDCSEYFPASHMRDNGRLNEYTGVGMCQRCNEDYYSCEDCGEEIHSDDTYYHNDMTLCSSCHSSAIDREDDYSCEDDEDDDSYNLACFNRESPDTQFHETTGIVRFNPTTIYHGFECEREINQRGTVTDTEEFGDTVINTFQDNWLYCTTDGSIPNGLEFISQPSTLELQRINIKKLCEVLKPISIDHRKTGIHVSASRGSMTKLQIAKIVVFVNAECNQNAIEALAGRKSNDYCIYNKEKSKQLHHETGYQELFSMVNPKFEAINLQHSSHIEFRLFASTCQYDVFMRYMEFVNAICKFMADEDMECENWTNWNLFLDFVNARKSQYPVLCKYYFGEGQLELDI